MKLCASALISTIHLAFQALSFSHVITMEFLGSNFQRGCTHFFSIHPAAPVIIKGERIAAR